MMYYNKTITNAVNKAVNEFAVRVNGVSPFDKKFDLCKDMLENKMSSIYSDLYAAGRLGLISDADVANTIDEIKSFVHSSIKAVKRTYELKIGEEAYMREWCLHKGVTYEWLMSED